MTLFTRVFCLALPLALFLPFDPQWPDFERARRGLFLLLVGGFVLFRGLARERRESATWPLWIYALASVASIVWAGDRWAAGEHAAYAIALAILPFLVPEAGRDASSGARASLATSFTFALLVVTLYGLAQGLGLAWPRDYTVPHEAVSTFGNRNVAAEAVAMSTPLALAAPPWLALPTLITSAGYLGLSGGRAGALPLSLPPLAGLLHRLRTRQLLRPRLVFVGLLATLAASFLGGHLLRQAPPPSEAATATASPGATRAAARVGDTIDVRRYLYQGSLELAKASLPVGVGAGNFRVAFPPYRDPREIAISSQNHSFGTRVVVAHNDPLQLLAELGVLGALVLVAAAYAAFDLIRRDRLSPIGVAALVAWLPLTLLRAPLFNAAACAALLVTLASCTRPSPRARRVPRSMAIGLRLLGLPLLAMGSSLCYGEGQGADFFRAKLAKDPLAGASALDNAVRNDPFEADWRLLRAQVHHSLGAGVPMLQLAPTFDDLRAVLQRRPYEVKALVDLGFLGLSHSEARVEHPVEGSIRIADKGRAAVATLLEIDPEHPQGLFLGAEYAFLTGNFDAGLAALERLGDVAAVEKKQTQVRALRQAQRDPDLKVQLARVELALGKLRDDLQKRAPR